MCTIKVTDVAEGQGMAVLSWGFSCPCFPKTTTPPPPLPFPVLLGLARGCSWPRDSEEEEEEKHTVASQGGDHEDVSSPSPAS